MVESRAARLRGPPPCQRPREAPISGHASEARRHVALLPALAILVLAAILISLLTASASAQPQSITKAKSDIDALRDEVDALNNRSEMAMEDYAYAQVELGKTNAALEDTQAKLTRSEKDLKTAQTRLAQRVDGLYRDGSSGFIEALFGARSFSDLINRFDLLKRVGVNDQETYAKVAAYRSDVAARKTKLADQQKRQKQLLAEAKAAKAAVADRLAEQKRALRGKEKLLAQLEKEEQARQARLAAEAKIAAQRSEAAAKAQRQVAKSRTSSGGKKSTTPVADVPDSAVGGSVIDVAMRYMGVPYVWGGSSPSGFDCSGFTLYVYGKVGVSLPHSSRAQFNVGVPVSRSQLQPGDLVFFGSPIHHVGLYVGNGNMIHAPHTGSSVRINSIDRSNYTGARRIL